MTGLTAGGTTEIIRCPWANADPLSQRYHDTEWGVPCHDERRLFKMLILEGMQAGLSWYGILKKMDTLCAAYDNWETQEQAPVTSPMSNEISRELKRFGFKFVGSTIIYAYLQAVGDVNDHIKTCSFRNGGNPA